MRLIFSVVILWANARASFAAVQTAVEVDSCTNDECSLSALQKDVKSFMRSIQEPAKISRSELLEVNASAKSDTTDNETSSRADDKISTAIGSGWSQWSMVASAPPHWGIDDWKGKRYQVGGNIVTVKVVDNNICKSKGLVSMPVTKLSRAQLEEVLGTCWHAIRDWAPGLRCHSRKYTRGSPGASNLRMGTRTFHHGGGFMHHFSIGVSDGRHSWGKKSWASGSRGRRRKKSTGDRIRGCKAMLLEASSDKPSGCGVQYDELEGKLKIFYNLIDGDGSCGELCWSFCLKQKEMAKRLIEDWDIPDDMTGYDLNPMEDFP